MNKITTVILFMTISIMKFVQSVCLCRVFVMKFRWPTRILLLCPQGSQAFIEMHCLRINITLRVRMIVKTVEAVGIIVDQ